MEIYILYVLLLGVLWYIIVVVLGLVVVLVFFVGILVLFKLKYNWCCKKFNGKSCINVIFGF